VQTRRRRRRRRRRRNGYIAVKALKHKTHNSESVRGKIPTILALSFATPLLLLLLL
jgi:hypothetical protein